MIFETKKIFPGLIPGIPPKEVVVEMVLPVLVSNSSVEIPQNEQLKENLSDIPNDSNRNIPMSRKRRALPRKRWGFLLEDSQTNESFLPKHESDFEVDTEDSFELDDDMIIISDDEMEKRKKKKRKKKKRKRKMVKKKAQKGGSKEGEKEEKREGTKKDTSKKKKKKKKRPKKRKRKDSSESDSPEFRRRKRRKKRRSYSSNQMNFRDAATVVLKDMGFPMSAREIMGIMQDRRLVETSGKTPHHSLAGILYVDIKVKGKNSMFAKAGRGKFALRKWEGYQDNAEPNPTVKKRTGETRKRFRPKEPRTTPKPKSPKPLPEEFNWEGYNTRKKKQDWSHLLEPVDCEDYYLELLHLPTDGSANRGMIKKQYRLLCWEFHPDRHSEDKKSEFNDKFAEISDAYSHLMKIFVDYKK